jgi:hypothetical protein
MAPKKLPKSKATAPGPVKETAVPNWPPLKPLLPSSDLALETLIESQIMLIRNFWTGTLCKNYVSFLKTLPLVTTPGKPRKGDAVRVNDRFQVDDQGFANRLWIEAGLRELVCGTQDSVGGMSKEERERLWLVTSRLVTWMGKYLTSTRGGEVLGLNPNIRIYRYSKGQFFDQHCEFFRRGRSQ